MDDGQCLLERSEFKYLVPEELCGPIREYLLHFCDPDPFTRDAEDGRYEILSLYLDTPRFDFYQAVQDHAPGRFKLRIRTYGTPAAGPVFFEVKRRAKDTIRKTRVRVADPDWSALLADGGLPPRRGGGVEDRDGLEQFLCLAGLHAAEPKFLVRYRREAYQSPWRDRVRVTFDRRLEASGAAGYSFHADAPPCALDDPISMGLPVSGVILELKFNGAAPAWMEQLVRSFGLVRRGFSKYCRAVERMRFEGDGGRQPSGESDDE